MNNLDEYLDTAVKENRALYEAHRYEDAYLSSVFSFTRAAKGHPQMTNLSADSAAEVVDEYLLRGGHSTAEVGWGQMFGDLGTDEDSDPRAEFLALWDQVRCLPDESTLEAALRRVNQRGTLDGLLKLPECKNMSRYARFLALAAELQEMQGDKPIFLPCREVGKILGVNKGTVAAHRKLAIKQGFLRQLNRHHYVPGGFSEATEFKFHPKRMGVGRSG